MQWLIARPMVRHAARSARPPRAPPRRVARASMRSPLTRPGTSPSALSHLKIWVSRLDATITLPCLCHHRTHLPRRHKHLLHLPSPLAVRSLSLPTLTTNAALLPRLSTSLPISPRANAPQQQDPPFTCARTVSPTALSTAQSAVLTPLALPANRFPRLLPIFASPTQSLKSSMVSRSSAPPFLRHPILPSPHPPPASPL